MVAIIHIYGPRPHFLLCYDNQDTESKSEDMEVGVGRPLFTKKNIKISMG